MCNSFKKLWVATIAALAISVGISNAQALRTITGVVVDETNLGIPGAYVVVKNETRGSITDVEGHFPRLSGPGSQSGRSKDSNHQDGTIRRPARRSNVRGLRCTA